MSTFFLISGIVIVALLIIGIILSVTSERALVEERLGKLLDDEEQPSKGKEAKGDSLFNRTRNRGGLCLRACGFYSRPLGGRLPQYPNYNPAHVRATRPIITTIAIAIIIVVLLAPHELDIKGSSHLGQPFFLIPAFFPHFGQLIGAIMKSPIFSVFSISIIPSIFLYCLRSHK